MEYGSDIDPQSTTGLYGTISGRGDITVNPSADTTPPKNNRCFDRLRSHLSATLRPRTDTTQRTADGTGERPFINTDPCTGYAVSVVHLAPFGADDTIMEA